MECVERETLMFEKADIDPSVCSGCGKKGVSMGVWKGKRKYRCIKRSGGCGLEWTSHIEDPVHSDVMPRQLGAINVG